MKKTLLFVAAGLTAGLTACLTLSLPALAEETMTDSIVPPIEDLTADVPERFPRFYFENNEEAAQLMSRYAWYHFSTRPGTGHTLFNKEYLTTSDMWLGGAKAPGGEDSIQMRHRRLLLTMKMDDDGYVHVHQHISHAHETGWPFPLWMQVVPTYEGITAGWHFQEDGPKHFWIWGLISGWQNEKNHGESATQGWGLEDLESEGLVENAWRLRATGPSPMLTTPEGIVIDAFNAPFLQLRWNRTGERHPAVLPYIEWLREGDTEWSTERRVYFEPEKADHSDHTGYLHSMMDMASHPQWEGTITRMRLGLAPGEAEVRFDIDSFFTVYDTRHNINNPIFIMASWNYFRWTGDIPFLRENINRMRTALRYQATVLGGLEHNHIRNTWTGHDAIGGWELHEDGSKTFQPGHGIGGNYWDILPFGWDDMYSTSQYYQSLLVMAEVEELIQAHPGWDVAGGALALAPDELRQHASEVKATANRKFWDGKKGRFIGSIDPEGTRRDYGFTFLNLDAIWYGIATDEHAREIMDWISGRRVIEGETSTGEDIYHWRFGPRSTTVRNIEWYGQGWIAPESIPWGGQVQDGGAVLGFSFYDLWARLQVYGPNNAWQRLEEILAWEKDVWAEGGYREYYASGKHGTTLQGGGTAGGLGIDKEFFESILIPSIVTCGFMGLEPDGNRLWIRPQLPEDVPSMGIRNLFYRWVYMDVMVSEQEIVLDLKEKPVSPLRVALDGVWELEGQDRKGNRFTLEEGGVYRWVRAGEGP